ncbi:phospholipid transfer protein-like [Leuresthes tenuis]|uniref:phospholipid transfer protein-like n=1 Tax=Leuresthes tenuis TaxID=355514 RepID=UPI003B501817
MTSCVLSLTFLFSLMVSVAAVDPAGLKVRITSRALTMLRDQAVAVIQEQLLNRPFEGFKYLKCGVTSVKLTRMTINRADISFQENSGFRLVIQNFGTTVSSNVCVLNFEKNPSFEVTSVSATMEAGLILNDRGRLAVDLKTCEASADRVASRGVFGSATDLFFSAVFCFGVKRFGLPRVNQMLDTIPMNAEVFPSFGISIDYSLTKDIQVTATSLDLSFKGLVFQQGGRPAVANRGVEPVFREASHMAYVGISEYVFNTAAQSFYDAGALGKKYDKINSKLVKAAARIKQFFTQPWNLRAELVAEVGLTEAPSISITQQQGVTFSMRARVRVLSAPDQKQPSEVNSVSAECAVSMKVSVQENRLRLPYKDVKYVQTTFRMHPLALNHQLIA